MRVPPRLLRLICLATLVSSLGCEAMVAPVPEEFVEVSGTLDDPETLLAQSQEKLEAIHATSDLHAKAGGDFRLRVMKVNSESALELASQVLDHPEATQEQKSQAARGSSGKA